MKIHASISDDGRLILSEQEQSRLKVFANESCVIDLQFEADSDAAEIARSQALDREVVDKGLQQEGSWHQGQG